MPPSELSPAARAAVRRARATETYYDHADAARVRWDTKGLRYRLEDYHPGALCRSCWEPIQHPDGGWPDKPWDAATEAAHEADREAAASRHAYTHPSAGAWTSSQGRTLHCNFCCPPPPLTTSQIDALSRFTRTKVRPGQVTPSPDLYHVLLSCEHEVEVERQPGVEPSGTTRCRLCKRPRVIALSTKLTDREANDQRRLTAVEQQLEETSKEERRLARARAKLEREARQLREVDRT